MKKIFVVVLGFGGLIITMIVPIICFGFVSMWIWGPDLMYRSLGPGHPSTIFFILFVPLGMLISAFVYLALVLLPLFASFDISLKSSNESHNFLTALAQRTNQMAVKYVELMDRVTSKKT
jgi:hypothetical protein